MVEFSLSKEQLELQKKARDFVNNEAKPYIAELDKKHNPEESVSNFLMRRSSEIGFRTMSIPKEYGGGGIEDPITAVIVAEELGVGDVTLSSIPLNGRKFYHLMNSEITPKEVKEKWLKAFCADPDFLIAIAMTEPDSGGDNILPYDSPNAGIKTTAIKKGDSYILNGKKHYIGHGGIAKLYCMFVRTDPTKGMSEGTSLFLIPEGHLGLKFGKVHDKLGFRLLRNQEIILDNCEVPKEWMLGPENHAIAAMKAGVRSDGILNAARCLGVARRAFEEITEFCKKRIQGGKPIIEHQAIACELADMYINLKAMRSLVWNVAWSSENETPDPKQVPGAMAFCTENAFTIAHKAAEIAGGRGVMKDEPFEKLLRDAFSIKHLDGGNYIKRFKVANALRDSDQYPNTSFQAPIG